MREIDDHEELVRRCGGDLMCLWAARGLDGRSRAWTGGDGRAVAIAGPGLSLRDRLIVRGAADAAIPLTREVLREVGPSYRPMGHRALIDALLEAVPSLADKGAFGWMDRRSPPGAESAHGAARWLPDTALPEVTALVEVGNPDSYAWPGTPDVERWAGVPDDAGRIVAAGALAWTAPAVGLIAGVAVHPDLRGRGLGRQVCGFLVDEALRRHGAAALMVDDWNHVARRLYEGLGLRHRPVRGAVQRAAGAEPA